jgi:hypothetical protein
MVGYILGKLPIWIYEWKRKATTTMITDDYIAVMRGALEEPFGLRLTFDSEQNRVRAARKFYKIRDLLREHGDSSFNVLSLLKQGTRELLIFQRDKITNPPLDDGVQAKNAPLSANDLPTQFRQPRGRQQDVPIPQLLDHLTGRSES